MKTFYHMQDLPCFVSLHFASRLIYIPATAATFLRVSVFYLEQSALASLKVNAGERER